jgi:proteic killer suppression protein
MDVRHTDLELEQMEACPDHSGGNYSRPLVRQFRRLMNLIRQVPNEAELAKFRSRHFEKLKGKRQHQHSLRLDIHWRLIVEIEDRPGGNCMVIKGIENHYE